MSEKVTDIQARHDAAGDGRRMDLGEGWQAHDDRGDLLAEIGAASDALVALGIPDDGRSLAERIATLVERTEDLRSRWTLEGENARLRKRLEAMGDTPDNGRQLICTTCNSVAWNVCLHIANDAIDREKGRAERAERAAVVDPPAPLPPEYVPAAGCDDCGNDPGQRHGVDCQSLSLAWLGGTREATIAKLPADIAATIGDVLPEPTREELLAACSPATRTFLAAVRAREATVEDFEAVLRAYAAEDRERKAWAAVAPPPEPERPPVARGADEEALDVYITADAALRGGRFDDVRETLAGLVGKPLVVMLAGLSITTTCIAEMGAEREVLYRAAEKAAGDRAAELLRGFGKDGA